MEKRSHFRIAQIIATCFKIGHAPKASGTVASLVAVFFWVGLWQILPSRILQIIVTLVLMLIGIWAIRIYEAETQTEDSSRIVIDEWVGIGFSLWCAPMTWPYIWAAFGLFRLFDIWKPIGVRYFDRNHLKGWGVMLDDVVAGIYATVVISIYRLCTEGWTLK